MDQLNHSLGVNALVSCGGDVFMESNDWTLGLSFKPTKFKWVQNLLKHILTFLYLQTRVMILKATALQRHWSEKLKGCFPSNLTLYSWINSQYCQGLAALLLPNFYHCMSQ